MIGVSLRKRRTSGNRLPEKKAKQMGLSLAVVTALGLGLGGCRSSSRNPTDDNINTIVTTKSYNDAGSRWDLEFNINFAKK